MQARIRRSRQVFYVSVGLMLGAAIFSATSWAPGGRLMPGVVLVAGAVSLITRIRYRSLVLSARRPESAELGGYPLTMLRSPDFIAGRRRRIA